MLRVRCLVLLTSWVSCAAWGVDEATLAARAEFAAAVERIESGEDSGRTDSAMLREYPLYPYLTSLRLQRTADRSDDAAIIDFLQAHRGEPVAFTLHRSWLTELARRRALRLVVDHYSQEVASTQTECDYLQARVELGETDGLAPLVSARWLTPARLPPSCEPAFQWLRDIGMLDAALTERRIELLLEAGEYGFARVVARRLPATDAERFIHWADLLSDPLDAVDAAISGVEAMQNQPIAMAVWQRVTRDQPLEAQARFAALSAALELDAQSVSEYARQLALGLAWDRRPEALGEFARVAEHDLDDYALGWLVRAASWSGDWVTALRAIDTMSPAEQARWLYWRARSLEALGSPEQAQAVYRDLLGEDNFYAAMAAARLGRRVEPTQTSVSRNAAAMSALEQQPAIMRARELFAIGRRVDATREWRYAMQQLSVADKQQAMLLASDWAWYDVAVATATEVEVYNDYAVLYPLAFDSEIDRAARRFRVADEILKALVRQESLFRPDAVSQSGALGLMQLQPATARQTAEAVEIEPPTNVDLLDAGTNIVLGAATLRALRDRYAGQLVVALAAYNAGPGAVDRWLPASPMPADVWIENIPYNETRDYVKRVIWHSLVFAWRQTGRAQQASDWLDPIRRPNA